MSSSADFDNTILQSINKKNAIEAMSGLYPHLPPAMIEQMYDFCSSPQHKDHADLLYYESNREALNANELKKYYKLKNKYGDLLKNIKPHDRYAPDQIIEDAITVGERLPEDSVKPKEAVFTADPSRFVEIHDEPDVHELDLERTLTGTLVI